MILVHINLMKLSQSSDRPKILSLRLFLSAASQRPHPGTTAKDKFVPEGLGKCHMDSHANLVHHSWGILPFLVRIVPAVGGCGTRELCVAFPQDVYLLLPKVEWVWLSPCESMAGVTAVGEAPMSIR